MNRKVLILAMAAVSAAVLALPAFAVAQSAHLSATTTFTIESGDGIMTRVDAVTVTCTSITGSGTFETTTAGKLKMTLHGCKDNLGAKCASTEEGHLASSATITTTELPFHLIMYATNKPAILATPNAATGVFGHFTCLGIKVTLSGNGFIGTITSPTCGASSTSMNVKFEGAAGVQTHMLYTGTKYDLTSKFGGGAATTSALSSEVTNTFPAARTLECTHTT